MICNKLDFSSFSGSVVCCNLEYKRSFLLNWKQSVERIGVAVLRLVLLRHVSGWFSQRTVGESYLCVYIGIPIYIQDQLSWQQV